MCFCDWHGNTSKQNKKQKLVNLKILNKMKINIKLVLSEINCLQIFNVLFNHTGCGVNGPYNPEKVSKQFYNVLHWIVSQALGFARVCAVNGQEDMRLPWLQLSAVRPLSWVRVCVCGLFWDLRHSPHTCRLCVSSPMTSRQDTLSLQGHMETQSCWSHQNN